jgi:hypothetical protein
VGKEGAGSSPSAAPIFARGTAGIDDLFTFQLITDSAKPHRRVNWCDAEMEIDQVGAASAAV